MQKQLHTNRKALSSLSLIILLIIAAIIGGLITYLWVTGYYISLNQKLPEKSTAVITAIGFSPQNATAFNVTVLNPSFSPDETITISRIAYAQNSSSPVALTPVLVSLPTLPFSIPRGESQTFLCKADWTSFVNQTITVSVFTRNGTGSTNLAKLPYVRVLVDSVDFNAVHGVKNFTFTLRNDPLSATYVNITKVQLTVTPPVNLTNLLTPSLPIGLLPNETRTFTCNYNWTTEANAGGTFPFEVNTKQGYTTTVGAFVPRLTFSAQDIVFNPADTQHFSVTVRNQFSTNTPLNISKIEVLMDNGTVKDVTPALTSQTNGVLGNSSATFAAVWNWTSYRNRSVVVTVTTLQGVKQSGTQTTPLAAMLSATADVPMFPDTHHFFVTVKNSQYSTKSANVTRINVTADNGTERDVPIVQPSSGPYLIGKGNTTMFSCSLNWLNYLNRTISIRIYTDEGLAVSWTNIRTPASTLTYGAFLQVSSAPVFNTANTTRFEVTVTNFSNSTRNATITRIAVLLEDGIESNATSLALPFNLTIGSTNTFTCQWDWTAYRNKNIVIRIYTDEGLKAIYITKTP